MKYIINGDLNVYDTNGNLIFIGSYDTWILWDFYELGGIKFSCDNTGHTYGYII